MHHPRLLLQLEQFDESYTKVVLFISKGVDWLLKHDEAMDGVVVKVLEGTIDWHFLMMPVVGTLNGELDIAGGFEAGCHDFFIVFHAFGDSF